MQTCFFHQRLVSVLVRTLGRSCRRSVRGLSGAKETTDGLAKDPSKWPQVPAVFCGQRIHLEGLGQCQENPTVGLLPLLASSKVFAYLAGQFAVLLKGIWSFFRNILNSEPTLHLARRWKDPNSRAFWKSTSSACCENLKKLKPSA